MRSVPMTAHVMFTSRKTVLLCTEIPSLKAQMVREERLAFRREDMPGRSIWWEGPLGTVAVIGIATKRASMQCQGYVALLGSDDQSWGWNLVDNNLLHNGEVNGNFPQCNNAPKYQVRT